MPELPEVETVCRELKESLLKQKESILKISVSKERLRNKFKLNKLEKIKNQKITNVLRKAKYLLIELEDFYLISHLGMTGSWRIENDKRKHDHIKIKLSSLRTLIYNDPRRFGVFDIIKKVDLAKDIRFINLGPDPVVDINFNGEYLFEISRKSLMPIKSFIMDQSRVVGVGNIYASEALYLSGIHPLKKASSLSLNKINTLAESIKETLLQAILNGGTTISDFRQVSGRKGYNQNKLFVYGRNKEACYFCKSMILSQMLSGRNTYWCPKCQKNN